MAHRMTRSQMKKNEELNVAEEGPDCAPEYSELNVNDAAATRRINPLRSSLFRRTPKGYDAPLPRDGEPLIRPDEELVKTRSATENRSCPINQRLAEVKLSLAEVKLRQAELKIEMEDATLPAELFIEKGKIMMKLLDEELALKHAITDAMYESYSKKKSDKRRSQWRAYDTTRVQQKIEQKPLQPEKRVAQAITEQSTGQEMKSHSYLQTLRPRDSFAEQRCEQTVSVSVQENANLHEKREQVESCAVNGTESRKIEEVKQIASLEVPMEEAGVESDQKRSHSEATAGACCREGVEPPAALCIAPAPTEQTYALRTSTIDTMQHSSLQIPQTSDSFPERRCEQTVSEVWENANLQEKGDHGENSALNHSEGCKVQETTKPLLCPMESSSASGPDCESVNCLAVENRIVNSNLHALVKSQSALQSNPISEDARKSDAQLANSVVDSAKRSDLEFGSLRQRDISVSLPHNSTEAQNSVARIERRIDRESTSNLELHESGGACVGTIENRERSCALAAEEARAAPLKVPRSEVKAAVPESSLGNKSRIRDELDLDVNNKNRCRTDSRTALEWMNSDASDARNSRGLGKNSEMGDRRRGCPGRFKGRKIDRAIPTKDKKSQRNVNNQLVEWLLCCVVIGVAVASSPAVLTPNHLLLGTGSGDAPCASMARPADLDARRQWRCANALADEFWRRRRREYLPLLQRRIKWCGDVTNVKIGEIVIICDDSIPRYLWPKGINERTITVNNSESACGRYYECKLFGTYVDRMLELSSMLSTNESCVLGISVTSYKGVECYGQMITLAPIV